MSDKEIPNLTDGGAATTGDVVHVYRNPNSRKATLGNAAGKSTGTGAGTVAAGDDSRITGAAPQSTTYSMSQVDALVAAAAAGVAKRSTVRTCTTTNITIATALNNGDTLNGVTLATGDAVLVKDQSSAAENGIYIVGVSPARSSEFDSYNEHPGAIIVVQEGTVNADTLWYCTSNIGGTLNSTAINFSKIDVDIAALIVAATAKTTPHDNDLLPLVDSQASNVLKKLTWSNVKATLKTYFDTLYPTNNPTEGSATGANSATISLGITPKNEGAIDVWVGGIHQSGASFSLSSTNIVFDEVVPTGVQVRWKIWAV